jgi:DNA replication protein DnaC
VTDFDTPESYLQELALRFEGQAQADNARRASRNFAPGIGAPDCPTCGGLGYFSYAIEDQNDPRFGKLQECACRTNSDAAHAARLARSGLTLAEYQLGLEPMTLFGPDEDDPERYPGNEALLEAVERWAHAQTGILRLTGDYGSGKTHAAHRLTALRVQAGEEARYLPAATYIDHVFEALVGGDALRYLRQDVMASPFMVIDELETVAASPFKDEQLFALVNTRYRLRFEAVTVFVFSTDGYARTAREFPAELSRSADGEAVDTGVRDRRALFGRYRQGQGD